MKSVEIIKIISEFEKYFKDKVKDIILNDGKWTKFKKSIKDDNCIGIIEFCRNCPFSAHNTKKIYPFPRCINQETFQKMDYFFNLLKQMRELLKNEE